MISIIQHIEYLMMRNDCVVVPGWGALVAHHMPATAIGSSINRPSRLIGFNPSITHNDALLATSLSRRHGIDYDSACRIIDDNVTIMKRQIASGSEVPFGRLGIFSIDENGKTRFEPTVHNEVGDEFFGLSNVEFETLAQVNAPNAILSKPIFTRKGIKVAASVAALIGMGILLSTPIIVDKSTQTASLTITELKTKPSAVVVKPANKATSADKQIVVIDDKKTNDVADDIADKKESLFNEGMPCDPDGAYLLVINSCKKPKQASALIKQYANNGIKAISVPRSKFIHIVVARSNSKKQLSNAKKLLPEKYRKAWVCM